MEPALSDHDEEVDHAVYPQARHHTYLPGAIHPISVDPAVPPYSEEVDRHELAVLEWPDSVVFPGMVIPVRFSDPNWIAYLQTQILQHAATPQHPVRFGLLLGDGRRPSPPPRRSWARQGQGPAALRRWSQQLIQEMAAEGESNAAVWDPNVVWLPPHPSSSSARSSRRSWTPDDESDTFATPTDPFVGRIGTIVTVLYRHGNDALLDHRRSGSPHLIVTAMGTSRFRIVGYRSRADHDAYVRLHQRPISLKYFQIEEIRDRPLPFPRLAHGCVSRNDGHGYAAQRRHLALVSPYPSWVVDKLWPWKLVASILVSLQNGPAFVGLWDPAPPVGTVFVEDSKAPWTEHSRSYAQEPVAFSFWLAANLPLVSSSGWRLFMRVYNVLL
jgi:hypothetical protein